MKPTTDEISRSFELVTYSRRLAQLGYTPATSGNLSVRLTANSILVTPTSLSKASVRPADLVVVDMNGRLVQGARKATSEIDMHLAIYCGRPDVNAVVHAHPPIATAFACSGRGLDKCLCQEAAMTLGDVPLAPYATTGTGEVAASLRPFLSGHQAILLANHGAVTYGASVVEAFQAMEIVEHLAQVTLAIHQLGSPRSIPTARMRELEGARDRYRTSQLATLLD